MSSGSLVFDQIPRWRTYFDKRCLVLGGTKEILLVGISIDERDVWLMDDKGLYYLAVGGCVLSDTAIGDCK